ncbi:MAG TPA: response regulator transcription factor, partial [Kofleriaceae bacterium]|nr:response regulator transcription factor [Kofleriaceae bacterium]
GIETTTEITKLGLDTRILVLTMHSDEQYALRSIQAGAAGFIDKGLRVDELCHAIREVHAGRRYLPSHLRELIRRDPDATLAPVDSLSRREFQVMCFLASGLTNREIADQLTISSKTVDTHRGNVLKKLRLRNNSDITRFAVRNGYIAC